MSVPTPTHTEDVCQCLEQHQLHGQRLTPRRLMVGVLTRPPKELHGQRLNP